MPDLHWEDYTDDSGEKGLFVTTDQPLSHSVAEGCIGQFLSDAKTAIDALWDAAREEKHELVGKTIEPTYHIVRYDLESQLKVLDNIKRQDMRPKHRDCRVIMKAASKRFSANSPLTSDVFDPEAFVKETIKLMEALHKCLLEQTRKRERVRCRNDYTE